MADLGTCVVALVEVVEGTETEAAVPKVRSRSGEESIVAAEALCTVVVVAPSRWLMKMP